MIFILFAAVAADTQLRGLQSGSGSCPCSIGCIDYSACGGNCAYDTRANWCCGNYASACDDQLDNFAYGSSIASTVCATEYIEFEIPSNSTLQWNDFAHLWELLVGGETLELAAQFGLTVQQMNQLHPVTVTALAPNAGSLSTCGGTASTANALLAKAGLTNNNLLDNYHGIIAVTVCGLTAAQVQAMPRQKFPDFVAVVSQQMASQCSAITAGTLGADAITKDLCGMYGSGVIANLLATITGPGYQFEESNVVKSSGPPGYTVGAQSCCSSTSC
jgi:hypothetical protein